jgi:Uri superfamily endonuclease
MPSRRPTWHFDFLKAELVIESVWFISSDEPLECRFLKSLCIIPQAEQPVRFFGSRDCRSGCHSHLIYFPLSEDKHRIFQLIKSDFEGLLTSPVVQIC